MLVAALYRFTKFDDPHGLRATISAWCEELETCGTLLLAAEGINGTVSGEEARVTELIARLRSLPGCGDMDVKYSTAPGHPFGRMKVKVKREIVTMGVEGLDPASRAGVHVAPRDWNALVSDPGTIVIDTRNDYEVALGSFAGAIDPALRNFREFPAWFARQQAQWREEGKPQPRVAMFCTGGVRCEKSTAYARSLGIEEVYHLQGGILKYLEEVPESESLWRGNCFVFDERVSVGHDLKPGGERMCGTCNWPVGLGESHQCAAG